MLPTRLLSYRRTDDGALLPRWLTARDEVWLRELASEADASDGRSVDAAVERILDRVAPIARQHGSTRRVVEAVWLIERRRWTSRVDAPISPEKIRRVVFDLAAERSREEALATAACELGLSSEEIVASLFADRSGARKLVAPPKARSSADLVEAFNLALTQALLARSTEVVAIVRANVRPVVSYAKLHGLMASFDETAEGHTRIAISGPLALFHETLKYGRALATWFPSVVATPGWSVEARVVLGPDTLRLTLDGRCPIPRTHAMGRAHDSKLEARLEKDLRRLGGSWTVVREGAVVRAGGKVFFPDFRLVKNGRTVLVEVVGFWTAEYLAQKAALLRECDVPLLLCLDARHAEGVFPRDPRVLLFKRTIDAAALIEACERCALMEPRTTEQAP